VDGHAKWVKITGSAAGGAINTNDPMATPSMYFDVTYHP